MINRALQEEKPLPYIEVELQIKEYRIRWA